MHLLTFDSDYLRRNFYSVGEYSFLRRKMAKAFTSVVIRRTPGGPVTERGVLVQDIRYMETPFRVPDSTGGYRAAIYTVTPFESFIYWNRLQKRENSIMIHLGEFLAIIERRGLDDALDVSVSLYDRPNTLRNILEELIEKALFSNEIEEEEDLESSEHNVACNTLHSLGMVIIGRSSIEFFEIRANCISPEEKYQKSQTLIEVLTMINRLEKEVVSFIPTENRVIRMRYLK